MSQNRTQSPDLSAWAQSATALTEASLALGVGAVSAMMTFWTAGMIPAPASTAPPRQPVAQPDPSLALTWTPGDAQDRASEFPAASGAGDGTVVQLPGRPRASSRDRRSQRTWYRAPYRSPFDPMFWLTPGQDQHWSAFWLAPYAGWGQATPFATQLHGQAMPPVFAAMAMAPAMMVLQWWLSAFAPRSGVGSGSIGFGAASGWDRIYSAYRTVGGHASAPFIWPAPPQRG